MREAALSPRVALAVAVVAVSWGSILARLCVSGPIGIAAWRLILSTLLVLPFAMGSASLRRPALSRSAILPLAAAGLLLALHFAAWIGSLRLTSVGSSVVLVSTQPLFGVILSRVILREAAPSRVIAGVLISLAGTLVIAWGDLARASSSLRGDLLALAGGAFAAGYFVIGRGVRNRIPLGFYLSGVYAAGAVVLCLMIPFSGKEGSFTLAADWPWLILMAAGPGVAGHGLLNWSVRRVPAYVVNAALLGEPILATLYAWLIFREPPGFHLIAGGALVMAGLAWVLSASSSI